MAHYPQNATGLDYITYPAGPDNATITLTSGTADTKGSYAEIASSSAFECNNVIWNLDFSDTASGLTYLTDLATGAGGAETVVVPNVATEGVDGTERTVGGGMHIPLEIASGTRIAARTQCSTGSQVQFVSITLITAGDTPAPTSYSDYGTDTANSTMTQVDPGGTANTKGSYSELEASTGADIQVMSIMYTIGGNGAASATRWCNDFATGAAGSEVVLIPDARTITHNSGQGFRPRYMTFLTYVASGTRIAARASAGTNDATDRLIYVGLVGAVAPTESASGGIARLVGGGLVHA